MEKFATELDTTGVKVMSICIYDIEVVSTKALKFCSYSP